MTFVLDAEAFEPGELALIAGLAACFTIEAALELDAPAAGLARGVLDALINPVGAVAGAIGSVRVGLRWPNDVVARSSASASPLKLAGCLVEVRDGLALVGIGVNVGQNADDFPPELAGKAASLGMLGSHWDRADVIERLVVELDRCVQLPVDRAVDQWIRRETLVGTLQTFEHDGRRFTGVVESVDPLASLRLRTDSGVVDLPALTTSLVKDSGPSAEG
jgi:biotin-(acetyl-CoA carboxylase) ligase